MVFSKTKLGEASRMRWLLLCLVFLCALNACSPVGELKFASTTVVSQPLEPTSTPVRAQNPTKSPAPLTPTSTLPSILTIATPTAPSLNKENALTPTLMSTPELTATGTLDKLLKEPGSAAQSLLVLDPIQIRSPGTGSQVVSPLKLEINFQLDLADTLVRIELRRSDGVLLARKLLDGNQLVPLDGPLTDQIEFEIAAPTSSAWLIVAVDPRLKPENQLEHPLAVNMAELTLSSSGTPRLESPSWQAKTIDIQEPAQDTVAAGGILPVSGLTRLNPDQPLKVLLIRLDGKLLSQRLAGIKDSPGNEFQSFSTELTYQISQPIPARVIVYRDDPGSGVIIHLASQAVQLKP